MTLTKYDLAPMLAPSKALKSMDQIVSLQAYACEEKLDGWRMICYRTEDGVEVYGGRNGSSYTGQLPYLEASLLTVPPGTVVDGEITSPLGFGAVQSIMRTGSPHRPTEANPALTYRIFDIQRVGGIDVRKRPWTERRLLVESLNLLEHMTRTVVLPTTQATVDAILAAGGEGVMLKSKRSRYVSGRSPHWIKIKAELTAEARVIGFKPGTPGSSFDGLVGALEFELLDTGVKSRCSGFDMELRKQITAHQAEYLGRIFELKFNPGVGKEGKPRSPNFLRWRDDRMPSEGGVATLTLPTTRPRKVHASGDDHGAGKARMRNYGAMKDDKLLTCIDELENGGDARDRVEAKGGDVAENLKAAREAAAKRGLS